MTCRDFEKSIRGFRLTTAKILYYLPDYPQILQMFLWQTYDKAPKFPRIYSFLDFWRTDVEAIIHSVSIASRTLVSPVVWRFPKILEEKGKKDHILEKIKKKPY